ncbi:MAG: type IV pilus assembly protein PilM [Phycisphaerae bacterium]|nr:type IV pilus assembly protein PilM [Phycisphaerae bacterium]
MGKTAKIAWGIDIGNCALKAMKVAVSGDEIELLDFAVIDHAKILSQPDITAEERKELIAKALDSFLDHHDIGKCKIVVSVPGQSSFARFVKLPPVEAKRIPELVRYEAIQQIPFDIDDVEWDWQIFQEQDSPELEVGIFAIRNDLVNKALQPFADAKTMIHMVQMAPMALFNFLRYDQKELQETAGSEAIITLDIGAENTDLVIADGIRVWQRSIPIGGNQFTAAVKKAFKLSFTKAETIKRSANTSKYARQIFQAMRPVFADLAAEIQRSLGFYSSSNRNVQYREVIAMGSAMKLPGLIKFLQQSLSLPVKRLGNFESLELSPEISVADFTAHLPSLSVAYGLAIQGVGQGVISSNLLPREIVRQTQWKRKKIMVLAACAAFVLAGGLSFLSALSDQSAVTDAGPDLAQVKADSGKIRAQRSQKSKLEDLVKDYIKKRDDVMTYYRSRDIPLSLFQAVHECVPNLINNPSMSQLYTDYNNGDSKGVVRIPRSDREQVFITSLDLIYTDDLNKSFDQIIQENEAISGASRKPQGGGGGMMGPGMMGPGMMGPGMMGPGMMGPGMMGPGMMGPGMMGPGMMGPGMMGPGMGPGMMGPGSGGGAPATTAPAANKKTPGFVVMLAGYTPHKAGLGFLNPPEEKVGLTRAKWGLYNRLRYLGKTAGQIYQEKDAKAKKNKQPPPKFTKPQAGIEEDIQVKGDAIAKGLPFETYIGEGDLKLFFDDTRNGPVSTRGMDPEQPLHLGVYRKEEAPKPVPGRGGAYGMMGGVGGGGVNRATVQDLPELLDSFTMETMSECYVKDENGGVKFEGGKPLVQQHDSWFRVNFKVKMKK